MKKENTLFSAWPLSLWLGMMLTTVSLGMAVAYLIGTPFEVTQVDLAGKLQAPSWQHWLGTDVYGRDVFSLLMGSSYSALRVSVVAIVLGLSVGVLLGLLASFCKGWVDALIMRTSEFIFAFPVILLAILLIAALGPGAVNVTIAIAIANVPVFARLTRNTVNGLLPKEFILAARALGRSSFGVMRAHIFPNLLPLLIVQSSVQLSLGVLAEATLTYLNLGVQPPDPSWGRMLYEAQTLFFTTPMLAVIPGCALALTVLGLNQLGNGLRDVLMAKHRFVNIFV